MLETLQQCWSSGNLLVYIISQIVFIYIPAKICLEKDLRFAEATALLMETCRMLMKMHAFVRSSCGQILQNKLKTDAEADGTAVGSLPSIQKYIYYLFAPTLLYRANYPRTSVIRWKFVGARFMEFLAIIFLYSFIYECHLRPHFGDFGKGDDLTSEIFITTLFAMVVPSILIFLTGFYILLHVWLNLWAELLRFGDRKFYADWWTSSDYAEYFRKWNMVVSEWFYEYVYREFYVNIFKGSKTGSTLAVYLLSAILHEYVMGYALQLCFPIMFMVFLLGGIFCMMVANQGSKDTGNIIVWFIIIISNILMVTLYCMEYYTSKNCPKESYRHLTDILVPHLWSCNIE